MPLNCSICVHAERAAIDRKLVARVPLRRIVAEHPGTSVTSLHRHKQVHLAASLMKAAAAKEVSRADSLLARIEELIKRCSDIAERANKARQWQPAVAALRECRCNLALLGELSGELRNANGGVNVGVGVTVSNGSNGANHEAAMTLEGAEREYVSMMREDRWAEFFKSCLYRAGHSEVLGRLEHIESERLIGQLEASKELRERVRLALIEADAVEIPRPAY